MTPRSSDRSLVTLHGLREGKFSLTKFIAENFDKDILSIINIVDGVEKDLNPLFKLQNSQTASSGIAGLLKRRRESQISNQKSMNEKAVIELRRPI